MKLGYGYKLNVMQSMVHVDPLPIAFPAEWKDKTEMKEKGRIHFHR